MKTIFIILLPILFLTGCHFCGFNGTRDLCGLDSPGRKMTENYRDNFRGDYMSVTPKYNSLADLPLTHFGECRECHVVLNVAHYWEMAKIDEMEGKEVLIRCPSCDNVLIEINKGIEIGKTDLNLVN